MIGGISWLLLEKILRVASGLLVSTAVARHLGPADYGLLAVAIAAVGIASAAANMGSDHINLAELARARTPDFLASAFMARVGWAGLCALGAALWGAQVDAASAPLYPALAGAVLATAPLIFTQQLYADSRFHVASLVAIVALSVGAASRIAGVVLQLDARWFALCFAIEAGTLGLGVLAWAVADGERWQPAAFSRKEAARYLRLCAPTLVSAMLVALYLRIELFVVGSLLGKASAGTWAAAMMFVLPWNMASAAVLPVVHRRLGAQGQDPAAQAAVMVRLLRAMALLALACASFNLLVVQWIVPWLLGPRYAAAAEIAAIASFALIPLFLGAVQDVSLAQRRRTTVVLRKVLIGLPLSLGLLALGATQAGLAGVAAGMLTSYAVTAILLNAWLDPDYFRLQLAALGLRRTGARDGR